MVTSTPLISVVLPVYNAEMHLDDTLQSLLDQTFSDFELIAYDDGSADRSCEILQRYADQDSRIAVRRMPHQGYSPLLNMGLQEARGEFFARMDADDICEPTRFERQVEFLRDRPDVAAVGSALTIIDAEGDPITVQRPPTEHNEIDRKNLRGEGGNLPHPTLMARTSALRAIGGYRPEFEPAEDLDLLLRLAEHAKLANLTEPLLRYRVHFQMTSIVKRDKQAATIPRILAEAHLRRGLTQDFASPGQEAVRDDGAKRRCLQSFHAGFYRSAQKYAIRNWCAYPLQCEAWSLLFRMTYVRMRHGGGLTPPPLPLPRRIADLS